MSDEPWKFLGYTAVLADGLATNTARLSAGTVMTKFGFSISMGLQLERLNCPILNMI